MGGRHLRSLLVFQTSHHVLSQANFSLLVCNSSEFLPLTQTLHELPFLLERPLGVTSKFKIFSDFFFLRKSLVPHF